MNTAAWWQRVGQVSSWLHARPVILVLLTCAGGILGVITIIVAALNAISAQQAVAMALPAAVTTLGGLINKLAFDSWTAWRRGFKQGCQACMRCQLRGLNSDVTTLPRRSRLDDQRGVTMFRAPWD